MYKTKHETKNTSTNTAEKRLRMRGNKKDGDGD
jgi:hypothetical protein